MLSLVEAKRPNTSEPQVRLLGPCLHLVATLFTGATLFPAAEHHTLQLYRFLPLIRFNGIARCCCCRPRRSTSRDHARAVVFREPANQHGRYRPKSPATNVVSPAKLGLQERRRGPVVRLCFYQSVVAHNHHDEISAEKLTKNSRASWGGITISGPALFVCVCGSLPAGRHYSAPVCGLEESSHLTLPRPRLSFFYRALD